MKIVLRYVLALILILTGAFFSLAVILAFSEIVDATIGIFSTNSDELFSDYLGTLIAAFLFLVLIFFCFRTALRIFKKTKKMKSVPEGSSDILDDMM